MPNLYGSFNEADTYFVEGNILIFIADYKVNLAYCGKFIVSYFILGRMGKPRWHSSAKSSKQATMMAMGGTLCNDNRGPLAILHSKLYVQIVNSPSSVVGHPPC
jgi:hypothetical protein